MPGKSVVFNIVAIILQYSLVVLIYYFLYKVVKIVLSDLNSFKSNSHSKVSKQVAVSELSAKLRIAANSQQYFNQAAFDLGDTVSIGRGDHNDIVIKDNVVSHEHACITKYKNNYWIADLKSTNGTFINDHQIEDEILLTDGDHIRIGPVTFIFER